jgi:hypothetical protein
MQTKRGWFVGLAWRREFKANRIRRSRYLPRLVSCRLRPTFPSPLRSSVVSQQSPPTRLRCPRFPTGSPISRAPRLRRRRWRLPLSTPSTCARLTGRAATSAPSSPTRDAPRSCSASRTYANHSPPRALVYSPGPPTTAYFFFGGPVASDWHGDSWAVGLVLA